MRRVFLIFSLVLAGVLIVLWVRVFSNGHQDYIEVPQHTRIHLLLMSDTRGFVFDVFIAQVPPEKAPGPTDSDATQQWLKLSAERMAAAYSRHFGFEKGIIDRHGQYLNDPIYFYGTDHYFAVPHLLLILLCLFPTIWLLIHRRAHKSNPPSNKSLQATRDGRSSSATAEDVISPACLSSRR